MRGQIAGQGAPRGRCSYSKAAFPCPYRELRQGRIKDGLDQHNRIAILIDGDYAQHSKVRVIVNELSVHGHMAIMRLSVGRN